jgi:DNA repair protein RAD7
MYDCTRLAHDSYITLANLCPNLETLHLHLCGQLSTDAVTYWGTTLKLKRIELFAPFLVRKPGWTNLFTSLGEQLQGFLVTQSPRIDLDTVTALVENCPNLLELRLAEIGQLNGDCLIPLARLKHLTSLDLSSPDTSLSSDSIVDLLSAIGGELISLNLSDNEELTDEILPAIATFCPRLLHLHLRNLPELTDVGVANFFAGIKVSHPGFETLDLEKGHDLAGKAVRAIIDQSGSTIEKLSLIGWRLADQEALSQLSRCRRLKELDLGWCRRVTDYTLRDILNGCEEIQTIRVWGESEYDLKCPSNSYILGCNQLTDAVPRKKGVKVCCSVPQYLVLQLTGI